MACGKTVEQFQTADNSLARGALPMLPWLSGGFLPGAQKPHPSSGSVSGAPIGSQCAERRIHTQLLMIVVLVVGVRVLPLFAVLAMGIAGIIGIAVRVILPMIVLMLVM